jgi:UDP-glucose 4-epimerase
MKKILITGANSFIGTSFEKYLAQWPEEYEVSTVDMIGGGWRENSFAGYDCVFHVAGIAHSDTAKVTQEQIDFYYKINTDLAVETARKAKADGVRQFIFMSSAIVYGDSAPIGKMKMITKDTPVSPANFYGDSKVQAENGILPLNDDTFKVVILRPPMIYGPGSKGNYPVLSKLARKLPVFPAVDNRRSMLFIENLMEFVRLMVVGEEQGIFWPQNRQHVNTTQLVCLIAAAHGKKVLTVKGFTWALKLLSHATALVNKAFGSLCYEQSMSRYKEDYQKVSLSESIQITEGIV